MHLTPADALRALREFRRVTRRGGVLYVSMKAGGNVGGWRDTAHGRRWFYLWKPESFEAAAVDPGYRIYAVDVSGEWVDLWAVAP